MNTCVSSFWLPPEWYPQSAVVLTWPHAQADWSDQLAAIEAVYVELARYIIHHEQLVIVSYDASHREHIRAIIRQQQLDLDAVIFALAPSNDTWTRDHGPLTVLNNGQPVLYDFQFNGWGSKYPAALDNAITANLHTHGLFGNIPLTQFDQVLEGGSIDTDGQGTLLTTRRCLLATTRNADMTEAHWETFFCEHFGIQRVLWLSHGELAGDDTDSHIDMLARFCSADMIAYSQATDPQHPNYASLTLMEQELREFRTVDAVPYTLMPLPLPRPIQTSDQHFLPASYANFLVINDAVLVPVYKDPADEIALSRIQDCFPGRQVVGIDCRAVIQQYGSLHCLTMQLPEELTLKVNQETDS